MQTSLTNMGMTMHINNAHPPLVYAQPSGLTSTWMLKYTVTLQSPPAQAYTHISNIMASAVLNVHPFLQSWLACMLSITSWAQLAYLSGYTRATILRTMHSTVPRIISRTPWDVDSTLQWCCHIVHSLPASRDTIFFCLLRWIRTHAVWNLDAYASWHLRHEGLCSTICAHWWWDFPVLSGLCPLLDPATSLTLGPCAWREEVSLFRVVCEHSDSVYGWQADPVIIA